jgi:hypothetical protein
VVSNNPSGGALQQAQNAANAGALSGEHFDGGSRAKSPVGGDAVIVPPSGGGASGATLAPSSGPGGTPNLIGSVPSPNSDENSFMASIRKMQTKPVAKPLSVRLIPWIPKIGAALGGILGGLLGFFLGGPIGMIAGAAIGAGAGYVAGNSLVKHLLH